MVSKNFIEDEFKTKSLFIDESVFEPEYIPEGIQHRENELIFLSRLFLPLLSNPYAISKKILITGSVGVGKTVTLHLFGKMIRESARKRNLNLQFIHINCRHNRTSATILKSILNELIGGIPSRGLSYRDFMEILTQYLQEHNCHLILVLDELGFIMKKDADLIYSLTRFNELGFSSRFFLSFIGIVKDILSLKNLDDATISSLQNEVIRFKNYSESQIYDILTDRVEIGLKPGVIDESVLKTISSLTAHSGDIRTALKLLKNAVRYAENQHMDKVDLQGIQDVNSKFFPLTHNELYSLNRHVLLVFLSICNILGNSYSDVTTNEIKAEYIMVCEHYKENPRSDTQLWEYIQILKKNDLITITIKNKKQRGRQSFITIPQYSVKIVKKEIEKNLEAGMSR